MARRVAAVVPQYCPSGWKRAHRGIDLTGFSQRVDGWNLAMTIYVSSNGGRAVGDEQVARRAASMCVVPKLYSRHGQLPPAHSWVSNRRHRQCE